jgi:hypothetical protein
MYNNPLIAAENNATETFRTDFVATDVLPLSAGRNHCACTWRRHRRRRRRNYYRQINISNDDRIKKKPRKRKCDFYSTMSRVMKLWSVDVHPRFFERQQQSGCVELCVEHITAIIRARVYYIVL